MEVYHKQHYFRKGESICVNKSVYIEGFHSEHTHDFLEIAYISQGKGYHWFNGVEIQVEKGDMFFINFNIKHYFKPISEDFTWINCVFVPEVIDPALVDSENAQDVLNLMLFSYIFPTENIKLPEIQLQGSQNEFENLLIEMLREYDDCNRGYQNILKHYLFVLLIKMFRAYSDIKHKNSQLLEGSQVIDKVIQYLMQNSLENVTLETIARLAFLSPSYFSTLFKQKTGQSVTQFLHKLRIEKACELLENTDMVVLNIMTQIGYKDTKFFYNIFRRYTKTSPGLYRKQLAKNITKLKK